MQIHNRAMKPWKPDHSDKALSYVANGEIEVGLGRVVPTTSPANNKLTLQSSSPPSPGSNTGTGPTARTSSVLSQK
jgi:hypothetical protein